MVDSEEKIFSQKAKEEHEKENSFALEISYGGGKEELERIFDEFEESRKRKEEILRNASPFLKAAGVNEQLFDSELNNICALGRDDFLRESFELIKPILDFSLENSPAFEVIERELFLKDNGLSGVLGYSAEGPTLHLHLAPCSSLTTITILREAEKGLKNLAKILEDLPEIQTIRGVSSIVEEHPTLMRKFGFGVTEIMGIEYDSNEPMKIAEITRADFLARWLKP